MCVVCKEPEELMDIVEADVSHDYPIDCECEATIDESDGEMDTTD